MNALINKTYLENSFKDFDTQILEKKYLNQEDPSIHTHDNKDILDRIGESTEGKLLFNEKEIVSDNDSCVSKDDVLSTSTAVKENTQAGKLVDALVVKEVFQSVSNGKELIASAITDKGVLTDATATFDVMAENISNIQGGSSGGDCPISSPYLFELNSKIPLSNVGGYIRFPFPVTKLKRIVIKKLYVYGIKPTTSNSSGSIYFYIKGKNTAESSESNVKGWGGNLWEDDTAKKLVDITVDTEVDVSGFEEITCGYLQKGLSNGTVIYVDVTLQFQAELYF